MLTFCGLVFYWRPGLCFEVVSLSSSVFHLLMKPGGDRPEFLCSFVYRPPLWRNKAAFWVELVELGGDSGQPWVCVGDFNDILR